MKLLATDLKTVEQDLVFIKTDDKSNDPYLRCKVCDFKIIMVPNPNTGVMPERMEFDRDGVVSKSSIQTDEILERLNVEYKSAEMDSAFTLPSYVTYYIKKIDLKRKLMLVEPQLDAVSAYKGVLYLIKRDNVSVIGGNNIAAFTDDEMNNPAKFLKNAEFVGVKLTMSLSAVYSPYGIGADKNVINISIKTLSGVLKYTISGKYVEKMKEKKELDDFIFG